MKKDVSNTDKVWLVKASESILGPFTLDDLIKSVRAKNIGFLDEVKTPNTRWLFVRDLPELQKVIAELANEDDTVEKTQTAAHAQVTITRRVDDDQTPIPVAVPIVTPHQKRNATSVSMAQASSSAPRSESVRSYSLHPTREPIPIMKWLMVVVVGASILLAAVTFWQKRSSESQQKKNWTELQQLYVAKLYDRAYEELKNYQSEIPDQPASLTRAGFLYLNPGRELVKARRLFERSSKLDPKNKELMLQNLNGLGLVSLYEGQAAQAKSFFDRALTFEPSNALTRVNMISLAMSQSKWDEAFSISQDLSITDPKKAYLIQAALTLLSTNHHDRAKSSMANLLKSFDHSSYLREEMRLLLIRLASLHSDAAEFEAQIQGFFEDLPSLQIAYSEDPAMDQRWKDWNFLYQFCSEITGPDSAAADLLAIQVVCISQIQKWSEAEKILTEGLKRFPNHTRLLLAQLHMLSSMGRWPEVRALMRLQNLAQEPAAQWMFAKSCIEEGNKTCAETYLNPLIQKPYVMTPVYELRAAIQCKGQAVETCRFSLSQGLAQDSIATGLLQIRYDLEESSL